MERLYKYSVSLCHNVGLMSNISKDTASENTEKLLLSIASVSFGAPFSGNPREYPYADYTARN